MRPEKKLLLDEIKEKIENAKALIVANYASLTPNLSWNLSQELEKDNSFFEVVKRRVFIKAAKEAGLELKDEDTIKGAVGVFFINGDAIEATKKIYNFSSSNDDLFKVLQGKYENEIYTTKDMEVLSKLPTKNQMRSEFLGLLEAPMSQTLSVMDSLLTSLLHCIENKKKKSQS